MHPIVTLAPGLCRNRDALISREWLVTNGIGGYAMGTVLGATTRAYHGYLIAATRPPVGRTLLLQHLREQIDTGAGVNLQLSGDEQADGALDPVGWSDLHRTPPLVGFALDGTLPVWTYDLGGGLLEKRLWMAHGRNTTYVQYTLRDSTRPVMMRLTLGVNDRDHHDATIQDDSHWLITAVDDDWMIVRAGAADAHPWMLTAVPNARCERQAVWSAPLYLRVEAERGLAAIEQRYEPATLVAQLEPELPWTLIASCEPRDQIERDPAAALRAEQMRQAALIARAQAERASPVVRQLVLAADQFIIGKDEGGRGDLWAKAEGATEPVASVRTTVIAGYPWFGDWGRDTMISLPGLCLSTRRFEVAAEVLRTFARFVSEGMLPNRFPDVGEQPEYNTADATLWYFHAIEQYLRAADDQALLAELFPTLAEIVACHVRGTRYGIAADPADGLLRAGEPGAQLTWMDVRIDEWVVTPRHGKAVEINALWCKALRLMAAWSAQLGVRSPAAFDYAALAEQVRSSFGRFWYAAGGYLYDVLDTPGGDDPTLRPNQIFALSLLPELLTVEQRRSALAAVTAQLWTPVGLRTLDPRHADYRPRFTGDRIARDSAYHQGTIWPWLIGHYVDARRQLDPDFEARPWIQTLADQLWEGGLGTLAEVYDAEPPRLGAGCMAQAWSVAELLRVLR